MNVIEIANHAISSCSNGFVTQVHPLPCYKWRVNAA